MDGERSALITALADSRFFTEAAVLALDPAAEPTVERSEIRQIVNYARFCQTVSSITREHYRRTAVGEDSPREYRQ